LTVKNEGCAEALASPGQDCKARCRSSTRVGVRLAKVERLEAGLAAVSGEVDAALLPVVDHERVAVQLD
jgi:hypothetical protein